MRLVRHEALTAGDRAALQQLFDDEYLDAFGPWNPDEPYGYAGHDVHVLAEAEDAVVGHVGWGRRVIGVGGRDVVIAGVGGVLVVPIMRGCRLGEQLMAAAAWSMGDTSIGAADVEFGFLGCREAVAPFYAGCGWSRITAAERSDDRLTGASTLTPPGAPLFVRGVGRPVAEWPAGDIDLRGKPW